MIICVVRDARLIMSDTFALILFAPTPPISGYISPMRFRYIDGRHSRATKDIIGYFARH